MTVILGESATIADRSAVGHRSAALAPRQQLRGLGRWTVTAGVICESIAAIAGLDSRHGVGYSALNRPLNATGDAVELLLLCGVVAFVAGRLLLTAALTPRRPDSGPIAICTRLIRTVRGVEPTPPVTPRRTRAHQPPAVPAKMQ